MGFGMDARAKLITSILFTSLLFTLGLCGNAGADTTVSSMGDTFVSHLPGTWTAVRGGWEYADIIQCFLSGKSCFGNNPTSPYGMPTLPNSSGQLSPIFQMNSSEAVVLFLRTPPQMRYFGFTQYLFSRPGQTSPVFASLSDTLNLKELYTLSSTAPGQNVFDQYAVIVWTADLTTLSAIQLTLSKQNIRANAVNFIPLPVTLPLYMGYGTSYDTFTMLMRTALPTVSADWQSYMQEMPFYVVKVSPPQRATNNPAPTVGYKNEISGYAEDAGLQTALDSLVADIQVHNSAFSFVPQNVVYSTKEGIPDCIQGNSVCAGDNHDALYSSDVSQAVTVQHANDVVIVVGVNHQKTGKALYINHAVYDTVKIAGITAVDDPQLTSESALYFAGVTSANDPRVSLYQNLYAYAISYDCTGLQYCLPIPPPTQNNPVGLNQCVPFIIGGRSYVEPHTFVRPASSEVIKHQVLVGTRQVNPSPCPP